MKKYLRFIIPALIISTMVGIRLWTYWHDRDQTPPGTLAGNGIVEATEVDVSAKVAGKILTLTVREGDEVQAGQLIATLDSGELDGQVANSMGNLHATEAQLAELIAGSRVEEIRRAQAQYDAAQRVLKQAQARRDLVMAGPRTEQIAQLRAGFEQAQARLSLVQEGPRQEQIQQLRAALDQARARRDLVFAGPRSEQIAQLEAAYAQAQARLSLVREGPRQEQIEQLRAAVTQAEVTLADAETELSRVIRLEQRGAVAAQQVDQATTRRDVALSQVRGAKQRLAEALNGARPQELREIEAQVEAARQRLAEAQAGARPEERREAEAQLEMTRLQLAEAEAGPRRQEVAEATKQVEAARQRLVEAQAGARPEERREVDAMVSQAQAQVNVAKATWDLAIAGPRAEAINTARARVEQARGTLATAHASQAQTQILAPVRGRVTLRNVEPGEMVTPGQPIIRVADLRAVWLRVYVSETQLGRIKLGQRTKVSTDTYPMKRYAGIVIEIAQQPEFTPKNVQTKAERVKLVFGVKIAIDNPEQELKPGMPADAVITVASSAETTRNKP